MAAGFRSLIVYQRAYGLAREIYELSRRFPLEERFSLTSQIRRSSRSVAANIAEGYRRGRLIKMLIMRFEEANAEAGETEVWIDFALECGYLAQENAECLRQGYDEIGRMLGRILLDPSRFRWKSGGNRTDG